MATRSGSVSAEELTGERRRSGASYPNFNDQATGPYPLVLSPKGVVRVWVRNPEGQPVAGANVTLYSSGARFPSVTGEDGTVTFTAIPAGKLSASASLIDSGTSGYSTSLLTYDDDVIEMNVSLAPSVSAHGVVYLPVPDDSWNGDPALLVPAPGILVEIHDSKGRDQLVATDEGGVYRFGALPTGGFSLTARNSNGDQMANAGGSLSGPDGFDNDLGSVILDASPPRLLSVSPPTGAQGVGRRSPVELVFSEPLSPAVLPAADGNARGFFSIRSASGPATGSWSAFLDGTHQVVRFNPSTQFLNQTVYAITIAGGSNGVRDRIGRPLTSSGNIGSTFKTSDTDGPSVVATDPDLARPVDPTRPIRFDFGEAVVATDAQLDGDFVGDAVELYWEQGGASPTWRRLPVVTYLSRSNFSLVVEPVPGLTLQDDTLRRRVVVSGLEDGSQNLMKPYEKVFRIYDANAPHVDALPCPGEIGASGCELHKGQRYVLVPALSNVDVSETGGDIDRVDYYFQDPTDPEHPVSPAYSARTAPFAYSFVAAWAGDDVTKPRPFPVWVQAVDTSTNASNVVPLATVVLPNTAPSVESVEVAATAPVPGTPYAGSRLIATVGGFDDIDDSSLILTTELLAGGWGLHAHQPPRSRPSTGRRQLAPGRFEDLDSSTCRWTSRKGRGSSSGRQ